MSGAEKPRAPEWVRQAVDFGALAAFLVTFGVLRLRGVDSSEAMLTATWVLMGGSAIALTVGWLIERRLALMPAVTGGFALVFGALTVIFQDPSLIKIKISVQNAIFAIALIGGVLMGKNPGKAVLGSAIQMSDAAWRILTLRYGGYFATVAVANEIIWRTQTDDVWIMFRGVLWIAALVFAGSQVPFMMKHMQVPDADRTPEPPDTGL